MNTRSFVRRTVLVLLPLVALAPLHGQGARRNARGATAAGAAADTTPSYKGPFTNQVFGGLRARHIGPSVTSGRVLSIAVDPGKISTIYVGSASGGVWKTTNGGAAWQPVFDGQGSYSIGWVTLDPTNPDVVWVGTGESNSQRSVSYGDGVYKSIDGGHSWKNVGLKSSEHIGRIVVDPKDPNVVYVAAEGPLWNAGGDRGLYKTTDGGATWTNVLEISENTGVSDVVMDPRNPDVLLAAAYQRRRHQWTMIDGGPEAGIRRSTDGGKTWTKISAGLPGEELGRIGLAWSTVDPDVVYAVVEAANEQGGIFRSSNGGVTWERRTTYNGGAMYYAAIFADPFDVDRIYVMDVNIQVSDDGGRTLASLGGRSKHVDNHVIWVDPHDADHYLVGNDGGVYQSWDRAASWVFFPNLPVTQFYDVDADNDLPFYNVYGGTQDNYSLGGPSRTRSAHGIMNQDWFVTQGGDGFTSHADPEDANIVYAEAQGGVIVRYDRRTGESVGIQPQEGKGDPPLRWNWDAPFIVSPHAHTRLYMGAQRLFRSDDQGSTWRAISPDLTRAIDRNQLKVMGKLWGPDAVAKNTSTAFFSNICAISESPVTAGLLYVGTDDGLIQVSEDGGATWRKVEHLPGVPDTSYVARLRASQHDAGTVYAAIENHKRGDFAPYLMKSTDRGRTWTSIAGDLPKRGGVYAVAEDPVDPNLLFAGTEFGAWFTKDGGNHWVKIAGLPTIAVRELVVQKRETDLVMATFGRGFYVLDDYTPLRATTAATLDAAATLFPSRGAYLYVPTRQYGGNGKAFQGEFLYEADNPPYGALLTFYRKDALQSLKAKRVAAEKAAEKAGKEITYPTADALRAEAEEEPPATLVRITDGAGREVRSFDAPDGKGMQRVAWDLRTAAPVVPGAGGRGGGGGGGGGGGPYVVPGTYTATVWQRVGGVESQVAGPVSFEVKLDPRGVATLADQQARWTFYQDWMALSKRVNGAVQLANETADKLEQMKRAIDATPNAPRALGDSVRAFVQRLETVRIALRGDVALARRSEATPVSIQSRVGGIAGDLSGTLGPPTTTDREQMAIASELFAPQLALLRTLVETSIPPVERGMNQAGVPWTPGRVPGGAPQ